MDLSRPHTAVVASLEGDILVALAAVEAPLTGRRIAAITGRGSQTGVNRALQRLAATGLVAVRVAGNSHLYALNRSHLAAPAVEVLATLRSTLITRLSERVRRWRSPALHVWLFGSAARGDGSPNSDIDLFVVGKSRTEREERVWRRQLADLAQAVRAWTGNQLAVAEVSTADLKRLRRDKPPVVGELLADAIPIVGRPARAVIGGAG